MCALPNAFLPSERAPIATETGYVPAVWREFFRTVQAHVQGPINLTDITLFTGTLPAGLGGTGTTAVPTAGGIAYGTGTALAWTIAGTTGQVWKSQGAGGPVPSDLFTAVTNSTTGNQAAVALSGASLLRCTNATLTTLQGIVPTYSGQLLEVVAAGAGAVVLSNEDGAATATNRLITNGFGSVTLAGGLGRAWAVYDGSTGRWRMLGWTPPTAAVTAILGITSAVSPYTILDSDATILADATTAVITVTLPAVASAVVGRIIRVKKTDASAHAVTVAAAAAETIDGAASVALPAQYNRVTVQTDGAAWWVL